MRPLFALLPLAFAVVLAPIAPVRVVEKKVAAKKPTPAKTGPQKTGTQKTGNNEKKNEERKDPAKPKQRRAPERAQWAELTPVIPIGDGPIGDEVEPELCPELAPALYARRLPAEPRITEPPTEPDQVSLVSGYLSLPPPVA